MSNLLKIAVAFYRILRRAMSSVWLAIKAEDKPNSSVIHLIAIFKHSSENL